ncbi:hypothetical protein HPB50_004219 [Hyalomma asiaticum]|uniref:Uncharacterized protein n=1 Tax=Hyalomma asiaticum TaxID=266040 RepID=A0ACB7TAD4_HYAAI|nr:hypothetical protein HPB50_004219 [Hyalomma asiaticum]
MVFQAPRASSPRQPRPKSPPPLPPMPHAVRSKGKPVYNSDTRDVWPGFLKLQALNERLQPSIAKDASSVNYTSKLMDENKQVVAICSLASAIRVLLDKMQTPPARSALQVPVAISPVQESLQKSSK